MVAAMPPDDERGQPSLADLHRVADDYGTTVTKAPTSIGEIIVDLFGDAVEAYHRAIDAERWDLVWSLGELIEAIDGIADQDEVG